MDGSRLGQEPARPSNATSRVISLAPKVELTLEGRIESMKQQVEEAKANLYARQGALAVLIDLKNASEAEFAEKILTATPTDKAKPPSV